ncbi:MAG: threonine/serine dehydratase [Bacteroidota bacterium]
MPQAILDAEARIRPYILETPLEFSPYLSAQSGAEVWLKLEHLQRTGSFKLRGAANKLLSLSPEASQKGVVTASTGNHAAAFAYMVDQLGLKGTIYLPETAAQTKIDALKAYAVELAFHGTDGLETEMEARRVAESSGRVFVSPYNDPFIIAGQGTIGYEIHQQRPDLDSIIVPVGGGGLISGIAGYLKESLPKLEVIGAQPENSAVMYESVKAGKIVDLPYLPTLSDGTAGGMEADSLTFPLAQQYVDDYILVSEDEIKAGLKLIMQQHYYLIEGAAALSVASVLKEKARFAGKKVVLILCGRKMGFDKLKEILST